MCFIKKKTYPDQTCCSGSRIFVRIKMSVEPRAVMLKPEVGFEKVDKTDAARQCRLCV